MEGNLKNIRMALSEVFVRPSYIALASVLAIAAFLFAVWLPNFGLISEVFSTSGAPLAARINIMLALLGGIGTNFSVFSAGYTIAVATLFGINLAMVVYSLKRTSLRASFAEVATKAEQGFGGRTRVGPSGQSFAAGVGGIASGALGIGCAACGSFILTAVLSSVGAAGALAILPLRGGEFGILGVLLLSLSISRTAQHIKKSAVSTI